MGQYIDLIVKIMIFVIHNFGDKTNTFLLTNIARNFYWSMHLLVCNSTCLKLEFTYFVYILSLSASHDNWCTATLLNRIITAQWEGMGM